MIVLSKEQIEEMVDPDQMMDQIEEAYRIYGSGEFYMPPVYQNQGNFPPIYVRLINWRLHFGQRMLILPLPRGTRTTWRQPGQRK